MLWRQESFWQLFRRKWALVVGAVLYVALAITYFAVGLMPARAEDELTAVGTLSIGSINMEQAEVVETKAKGKQLIIPDEKIAIYSTHKSKLLLMAHSETAFRDINRLNIGDEIIYNGEKYEVLSMKYEQIEDIKMSEILKAEEKKTIVLMTCAGKEMDDGNFSERLIIEAR
jgi:LPXTG-site transpeptidase (sortase) family protein